jgi:DNA polymerase alpha subunit A
MISSTTWSLSEMCATHLKDPKGNPVIREEIDQEDVPEYFDPAFSGPARMLGFVKHCEMDTFLQMAIAAKVQILPLTQQLTNLSGNSWCVCFISC